MIHSDSLEFESKKPATKERERGKSGKYGECIVVFTSVENGDLKNQSEIITQTVKEINQHSSSVGCRDIVIYPYAHLSNDLESPNSAMKVLDLMCSALEETELNISRAPFGWYKSFNLSCKGHELSELSRRIRAEKKSTESVALAAEEKKKSEFYVLNTDGSVIELSDKKIEKNDSLTLLIEYETKKARTSGEEPPHIKLMQRLELVDREPGSDAGNMRWYPKGTMIKRLLEHKVERLAKKAGAMEVETPEIYDYEHPCLEKYLERFPARQYKVMSGKKPYFMRFAACFGQFLIARDAQMSYKHLPIRYYELARSAYRRERRGELAGLRRLRAFTMPDMHTFVKNLEQGLEEMSTQFSLSMEWMESLEVPYEAAMRVQKDFFEQNREFYNEIASNLGRPMLLELFDERYAYFITKFEFNVIDTQGKAAALSTVQIDVENAERFEITYVDRDGKKKTPYILHASLSGSIDRNLYALLEEGAAKSARGEKPSLPFWLCPTQLRLLPLSLEYVKECVSIAKKLTDSGFRVDIDDREEGLGKKIREGEKEWIPLMLVIGEKEAKAKKYPIRVRNGNDFSATVKELTKAMSKLQKDEPRRSLPLPDRVGLRSKFRG